jgi:uncharacterized protein (TIGR04255 family)
VAPQSYKRPPITEAVIQIAFNTPMNSDDLKKADSNFARLYPNHKYSRNIEVEVGMPPRLELAPAAKFNDEQGHRRSTDDQTQIIILWPTSLVFSQLSPYPGWDQFFGRFVRDWTLWKKVVGYRRISRVGVRYINRIDIPMSGPVTEYERFLNVYPHLPETLGPVSAYGTQVQLPVPEIDGRIIINSSSVPSPLLAHMSFLFDQDIVKENDVPQNDDGLYNLLNEIHDKKNAIFEACITNSARELFNT